MMSFGVCVRVADVSGVGLAGEGCVWGVEVGGVVGGASVGGEWRCGWARVVWRCGMAGVCGVRVLSDGVLRCAKGGARVWGGVWGCEGEGAGERGACGVGRR